MVYVTFRDPTFDHQILKCSYYAMFLFHLLLGYIICTLFLMYFLAGLEAFRTFLKSEFSEENVEFWLACEDFKKTDSVEKIASKAKMIYSEFIEADAPKEVSEILYDSNIHLHRSPSN